MNVSPDVSVVMSVYNGAADLRKTVESILMQDGVSLEFIIVNDGSTDESPAILDEYARRDTRVRIIHQENQGLTAALIRGCASARGRYIARQDTGDVSLPDRFARQVQFIKENPDCAFASCGTRYVGPRGEHLYDVNQAPSDATERLLTLEQSEIRGPSSHASALFSTKLYESVGGYRPAFYFAQDLDLWVRLAERGKHVVMPQILYEASITVGSLSGLFRKEQIETTRIILESAKLRREGLSEETALTRAETIKPVKKRATSRLASARALYFIGSCLRQRNNPQAAYYFRQALKSYPLHLKSAARLLVA